MGWFSRKRQVGIPPDVAWARDLTAEMRQRVGDEVQTYQTRRDCEAWEDAEMDLLVEQGAAEREAERLAIERRLENKAILLCGNIIGFYRESGRPITPNMMARVTAAVNLGALMQLNMGGKA